MSNTIAFVGLGFEAGQTKEGIALSSRFARKLLKACTEFTDFGDVSSTQKCQQVLNYADLKNFDLESYAKATNKIIEAMKAHPFTLNWGGDHSVGWATVSAFLNLYPQGKVVWIDAHADLNRPDTSPTGSFHGMPVSFLLGLNSFKGPGKLSAKLKPEQIIYFGLRSLDPYEEEIISSLGIVHYTSDCIHKLGMQSIIENLRSHLDQVPLHVSFDIDSVDPQLAPATGVPVDKGLTLQQLQSLGLFLSREKNVKSLDVVEINPLLGSLMEVERTYEVAFEFIKNFIPQQRGINASKSSSNKRNVPASPEWDFSIST